MRSQITIQPVADASEAFDPCSVAYKIRITDAVELCVLYLLYMMVDILLEGAPEPGTAILVLICREPKAIPSVTRSVICTIAMHPAVLSQAVLITQSHVTI